MKPELLQSWYDVQRWQRCTINSIVNKKPPPKLLLETGAQLSLIDKDKLESNFPDALIQDISSILNCFDSFRLSASQDEM